MTADRQGVARPDLAAARLYTAVVSDILDSLAHRDHTLDPAIRLLVGFQNSALTLDLVVYAARSYSLMRPPRTARRLIRS